MTVQHIGSKERAGKARTTTTPASTAAILNEDVEDIDLLVEIAPNSPDDVTTEDFQRIRLSQANRGVTNSTDPAKRTIGFVRCALVSFTYYLFLFPQQFRVSSAQISARQYG